jgi:GNAT superfamily N-acetyltransferase
MGKPKSCPYIHLLFVVESMRGTGVGSALVDRMLAWTQEKGYPCCSVEWHTANLSAAFFWERGGFTAVKQALTRHVDERIAWAH